MPQSVSRTAAGASTALGAVNQEAPPIFAVTKEVVGALDPRLKALVVVIEEIHSHCLGVKINKQQCLTLCSYCSEIVANINKSVKAGLSLDDKAEHIDHLHRLLVKTAMKVQTISNHGLVKAFLKHDTIKATLLELRTDLTNGFMLFNISSLLALQVYAAQFATAAAEDRQRADTVDSTLQDIRGLYTRMLDTVTPTEALRLLQLHGRMALPGSEEQAAVFTELRSVQRHTGDSSLPLADLIDEAQKVGNSPVSEGSNGKLWRGIWLGDSSMELALKFPCDSNGVSLNRVREFHRSVEILHRLKHRNVIPLMGVKYKPVADDKVTIEFIAMPWVKYGNVLSFLAKFPDADRVKLMFDIACGLTHLHGQSPPIVHRAIEPSHILVDAEGTAIISSFSVAKALDTLDSTTYTVSDGGRKSLRWMAPEVSEGECDTPADVYSWSITTLSVISGVDPFAGTKQPGGVVLAVAGGLRPDREKHTSPLLTDKMWDLLQRCWHQEPAKRPTMADVVHEITSMRSDLPVV